MMDGQWAIIDRGDDYTYFDENMNQFRVLECGKLTTYSGPQYYNGPNVTFLTLNHYRGEANIGNTTTPNINQCRHYGHEGSLYRCENGDILTRDELAAAHPTVICHPLLQIQRGIINIFNRVRAENIAERDLTIQKNS